MSSRLMTIVIVLDHAHISGGLAKVAIDSAIGLKRAGHRPIVFAAAGPVEASLVDNGVEVVCLGQSDLLGNPSKLAGLTQGTWNFAAARALRGLLASLPRETTVVHVHGWAKALSPSIAAPIRASGLAALYTIHEYFMFCPNGGFYNYQSHAACPLTPLSGACWATHCDARNYSRKLWRAGRLGLARFAARLPQTFSDYVTISKFQGPIVAPYLPADVRLHDVSNPIEADDLGDKPEAASGEIIFVGRISPEKGPFLFAAAAQAAGIAPVFVGDGPAAAELAQRFPQARILGWKRPDEVKALLRAARALAFPSLWYEGQPLTVLEAKAMGTPVIVSDGCAGREEVEHGVTGLWFKSADETDLAAALRLLAADDDLVRRMSQAARRAYWADPPSLTRHVERIGAVYAGMLARRAA